jgi:peptidoglycan/LPS O-acetylase OafA/YrhL
VYFPSVDILRGFAALSVLVYHVIETWGWNEFPREGLLSWFRIGWLGVDLFFVISGFVIGLTAFADIDRHGAASFRARFWRRRLARIVPLYYLTSAFFVLLIVERPWPDDFGLNVISHALFVHNLFPSFQGALNPPSWSLGVELQFYLFVMLVAPWLRGRSGVTWLVVMMVLAWIWRFAAFQWLTPLPPARETDLWFATVQLPGALDEFAAGLLLAVFLRGDRGRRALTLLAGRPAMIPLTAVAAGLAFWLAVLIHRAGPPFWQSVVTVTTIRTPLAVAAALLLLIACSLGSERWLRWSAPFRYLGTISYGIYLWHWIVLLLLHKADITQPVPGLVLTLAITVVLATLSWHVLEKPIIKRFSSSPDAGE